MGINHAVHVNSQWWNRKLEKDKLKHDIVIVVVVGMNGIMNVLNDTPHYSTH